MKEQDTENKNLKDSILEVTGRMFLQYGYSGTTFQKVADELHIAKGSITYHFKNKFMIMETFIDDLFLKSKNTSILFLRNTKTTTGVTVLSILTHTKKS